MWLDDSTAFHKTEVLFSVYFWTHFSNVIMYSSVCSLIELRRWHIDFKASATLYPRKSFQASSKRHLFPIDSESTVRKHNIIKQLSAD